MSNFPSPDFSVVIPLFNKERTVTRCLLSILNQTCPPSEIIIVNDGSTDYGRLVAGKIADPRIRFFDQENGGVSRARNFGLAQARHELVALLDADDEWHPTFLETMASLFRKFPDAGLYYAAHNNVHAGGMAVSTAIPLLPSGYDGYVDIFSINTDQGPCSSSVVIRKSLLESTGLFDSKLVKGEDIDLWIRFALNGPVAVHNAPLSTCHGDAEIRATQKPCPPERCLIANLSRYEAAARQHPQFYRYLQQMRVAHICNFLGGNPCELADAHREIDHLDLSGLPPVWACIRRSPRCLRRAVFKIHIHGARLINRLSPQSGHDHTTCPPR